MTKKRKSLAKPRHHSFLLQNGLCFYCNQPMWETDPTDFSKKYGITEKQARILKCTGEHLHAHQSGGKSSKNNIVAACFYCNQRRHRRKGELDPTQFKHHVVIRLNHGKWHGINI